MKGNYKEIKKIISKFEYVSFDIFDTLIKRNLSKPSDLFYIVQKKYENLTKDKLDNWKTMRIEAEKKAREEKEQEEITLEDIYKNINMDVKSVSKLKELEIETELELCEINNQVYDLYKYCMDNKKKIIIISDMYLPKSIIEKILKKNNIMYDNLFLSSEIGKTKRTGNLFKFVLHNLKIKKCQIIHIGDNKLSDYISAKALGISAVKIDEINKLKYHNTCDVDDKNEFNYNCLKAFLNNNIDFSKDYYWRTGYEIFGPLLYGYVKWLNMNFEKDNNDNIYFLSRDGYIMQKAFEIVYPKKNTNYIYASRRALLVPTIWLYSNFKDILQNILLPREITVKAFLKKFGLIPENYKGIIEKYGYSLDYKLKKEQIQEGQIDFYKEIEKDIYENSKEEYENLIKYYDDINFKGKVAIVDIGWYGNMQHALEKIKNIANLDVDIYGYYVGIVPESSNQITYNMKGFLFDKNREDLFLKKKFFNALFEIMFLAHHGSVKKYSNDSKRVELYSYEYENTDTNINIQNFQEGALQFVSNFSQSCISKYIEFDENIAMYNLLEFGNRPKIEDIKKFGDIKFYDDDYYKIIEAKSLFYYIFHFKKLKNDLESSIWKTGFLKKIFKINLPYYEILLKIRGMFKKNL